MSRHYCLYTKSTFAEYVMEAANGVATSGKAYKVGRLVLVPVQIHATDTILPANTTLVTGLPKAFSSVYCIAGNSSTYELVGIKNEGDGAILYSLSNISTSWCYGSLVYVANSY